MSNQASTTSVLITFAFLFLVASQGAAEPRIGVLTLHAVGSQRQGSDFDAKLREILQDKAGEKTRIVMGNLAMVASRRGPRLWRGSLSG